MHLIAQSHVRSQAPSQPRQSRNCQRRRRPGGIRLGLLALVGWALAETFTFPQQPEQDRQVAASLSAPDAASKGRGLAAFGQLPLYFIENQGQVDERVAYYVQGSDTALYFTPQGITFTLSGPPAPQAASPSTVHPIALGPRRDEQEVRQRWGLRLDFVGANPQVVPLGQDPTAAVISYFKGSQEQWHTGLKTYATLRYPDLWPGIDLVYSGTVNRLKYTFVVKPGADPQQIKLAYRGATTVTVDDSGQLQVTTPVRSFQDDRPYAYQELRGQPVEVATAYELKDTNSTDAIVYGFQVGAYDSSKPLMLDPAVLVYAGFIGGSGDDRGFGIAVDSAGNAYVTGRTSSSEASFPVTVGPDLTFNNNTDAFVAKVKADGTGLDYAGYLGGIYVDEGRSIAVDSAGNAYVTGLTGSGEPTFPVTVGPDLTYNGGGDAFVAKVTADGTGLDYAGYLGGTDFDEGRSIAVDSAGNAYVTGTTSSTEATFPVTVGPDVTFNGGGNDAFVAKVTADGTGLDYAGYLGGSNLDGGAGIAVDSAGNAYVTGTTSSTEATFPVTVGPDLTANGFQDAFVAKVTADGTGLDYAGYLGGSELEGGASIAVDSAGNAYVTGATSSNETTFPVTVGPDLIFQGAGFDAFVAKVTADGTGLDYAGYLGSDDTGQGIAVDSAGNAYVTGFTFTSEASFPVTVGPSVTANGGEDAFVAKIAGETVDADATPPIITPTVSGTMGTNGWYTSTVSVSWSVVDNESAITMQAGCGPQTVTTDTPGITFTCQATSAGGTAAQSVTIKRDATVPVLSPTVSPNPVLLNGAATASPGASDTTSGLASASCGTVTTSSVGSFPVPCTATDNAGNIADASTNYLVTYQFPGFLSPLPQDSYRAGATIRVKFRLADASGVSISDAAAQGLVAACRVKVGLDTAANCASYDARNDLLQFDVKVPKNTSAGTHQIVVEVRASDNSVVNTATTAVVIR